MYYSDFNGLEFLRAHAGMHSLPLSNGLDPGATLGLPIPVREPHGSHLSPSKGSPPHGRSSPRPGSANTTSTSLSASALSSGLNALNLIQTPKHGGLKPSSYSSPPPIALNPEHNVCKLIDYRGSQVAAFMVDNRELICLPQAFELFLKHLVGGLHTVYTKLKRLEITPVVCNVEQVRILRGLGAIQPGVNRCKLISCSEFDTLYDDCTNSNARPGRPPKRVHSTNPVDTDVLEKLKRRKLEIGGDYPYDQRFYDRKPLMNGFPPMGYPTMPQFSNFFSMHHLMQPMAMASHIGLRPDTGVPKLDRTMSDSGIVSPRPRDDRLPMLGMYGTPPGLEPRLPQRLPEGDSSKPLDLQVNGHHKDKESDASRSDDDCDIDDDKLSEEERQDEDLDDSFDSEDYHNSDLPDKPRPGHSSNPFSAINGESEYTDFESFVAKFNAVVRALVDAAKAVERRAGEEKNQISVELLKEKERRIELEKAMQDERKKREFFQRRVRRLKRALRCESSHESGKSSEKLDRPQPESSPEPAMRNTQDSGQHDSDIDRMVNTAHSEIDRKSDSSSAERPAPRREMFDSFVSPHLTPPTSSPIKFSYHSIVPPTDV
ncbi:hypothetical protein BsWGS_17744 [Bradybaena similaris]